MTYSFTLDEKSFQKNTSTRALYARLHTAVKQRSITTPTAYNAFLKDIIKTLRNNQGKSKKMALFEKEVKDLTIHSPLIEITPWGGVCIKKVDTAKNFVQKLLIVREYGILGFEIHNKKLERLHILEGNCLLISSQHAKKNWKRGQVVISLGQKGDKAVLQPEDEHGIIALTNCVIEETSTNNLDDLVFIFPSKQVI